MKLRASLIVKHYGGCVSANTCIGGQSVLASGQADSAASAVSQAADGRFEYVSVLAAVDFTRMLPAKQEIPNVLYVQVHPLSSDQLQPQPAHESQLIGNVISFSLRYDFSKGFVNLQELCAVINRSSPKYIAVNTPFVISKTSIEDQLCSRLSSEYPHVTVSSSRHLTNRDFFTRGNTLLLNLLLRPEVERYAAGLKSALSASGISCPVFFLRNAGMSGESALARIGMDTCRSEELCFLYDALALHAHEDMYIADWASESLYFIHQGAPQMIRMPVDFGSVRIYGQIPVCYSLQNISSCGQLLEMLNAHNPYPGPVPLISAGNSPFPIPRLFEYPAIDLQPALLSRQCGLRRVPYVLEAEAYDHESNAAEAERRMAVLLKAQALRDAIPGHAVRIAFERLPLKYLNDGQLIIRGTLRADLGVLYETDQ